MDLTLIKDVDHLLATIIEEKNEARRAALKKAKTNLQALMIAGVVSYFPEDEQTKHYIHERARRRADATGMSFKDAMDDEDRLANLREAKGMLSYVFLRGETEEENTNRRMETLRHISSRVDRCQHGRKTMWIYNNTSALMNDIYICKKCGEMGEIASVRGIPTPQAVKAGILLEECKKMLKALQEEINRYNA